MRALSEASCFRDQKGGQITVSANIGKNGRLTPLFLDVAKIFYYCRNAELQLVI